MFWSTYGRRKTFANVLCETLTFILSVEFNVSNLIATQGSCVSFCQFHIVLSPIALVHRYNLKEKYLTSDQGFRVRFPVANFYQAMQSQHFAVLMPRINIVFIFMKFL